MWLFSPNIKTIHGFSNRHGGFSEGPFATLNLGGTQDDPEKIKKNRVHALSQIDIELNDLSLLNQVHGTEVKFATCGRQEGDALVTMKPGIALAVSVADCYPVLFHDPVKNVIGAAHCGWRGTLGRISSNTVSKMVELGAEIKNIHCAIGQGISQKNFEVGEEVKMSFLNTGFPGELFNGRYLDLMKANEFVLTRAGISPENIWSMNRCTFEDDFFSYRRDNGVTGRMWGVIMLKE